MKGRNILLMLLFVLATMVGCTKPDERNDFVPPPDPYVPLDGYLHITNSSTYPYRVYINGVFRYDLQIGQYRKDPMKPGSYAIKCIQKEGYKGNPGVAQFQVDIQEEKTSIVQF